MLTRRNTKTCPKPCPQLTLKPKPETQDQKPVPQAVGIFVTSRVLAGADEASPPYGRGQAIGTP